MNIEKIKIYLNIIVELSRMSKDPNTKVGSIILRADHSVVSVGYNGFPANFPDDPELWNNREIKNKIVIHAEENALTYSKGEDLTGYTIIVTHYPCSRCAAKIVSRKIKNVFFLNDKRIDHDSDLTDHIFKLGNVEVCQLRMDG